MTTDTTPADQANSELQRTLRACTDFSDIITNNCIAMQAALIDAEFKGADAGMTWIENTLMGPGLLPDYDEALALSATDPAQAWFDVEMAKHEDSRLQHPGPAIEPKPGYEVAADLAMMLKLCVYRLRRAGSADLADCAQELLRKHGMVGTPLRQQVEADAFAAKQGTLALDADPSHQAAP